MDEKNDGCHSCANLLDEMKEAEESLNFKMNELKEKHQQQLSDLRRSHNEELSALRRENAELKKRDERQGGQGERNETANKFSFWGGATI